MSPRTWHNERGFLAFKSLLNVNVPDNKMGLADKSPPRLKRLLSVRDFKLSLWFETGTACVVLRFGNQ